MKERICAIATTLTFHQYGPFAMVAQEQSDCDKIIVGQFRVGKNNPLLFGVCYKSFVHG